MMATDLSPLSNLNCSFLLSRKEPLHCTMAVYRHVCTVCHVIKLCSSYSEAAVKFFLVFGMNHESARYIRVNFNKFLVN
jgi:hypothetical protein